MIGNHRRKVLVVGLDCVPPELLFRQYRDELPHVRDLMARGLWGELESCHPPITVPAWSCMMASQDPGQLGIYGFRNRADYSYDKLSIATGNAVKVERVWDLLSRADKKVVVVGVPGTYPPRPVNGVLVSCFLTPGIESQYTHPAGLREEIAGVVGEYMVDVKGFRTEDKDWLLRQIYEMTEKRLRVVRHFLRTKPWDFFMFVEMGTDRIHHGFWKFSDPGHRGYEPGNRHEQAIRDYYRYLDRELGELLAMIDQDTVVLVVSDHGAKKMDGGICINEWLWQNGYLTLHTPPARPTAMDKCAVDWSRTRAWSEGGYYARLFLNVKGREPQGVIEPRDYERVRDELAAKIAAIPDHQGRPLGTQVYTPQALYRATNNIAPDLLIYFGDLSWRSVGTLGTGAIHTFDNDTGPDDANHAQQGILILHDPAQPGGGREIKGMSLYDVAPTILHLLGQTPPPHMIGKSIV
ncbi:MAG: alkaline phosphatase family protein [candidate division KSB1 bacterium]|nr:alkaline phosphatase family protein [candidate division KSB1 bacterium]MDZ7275619.1 alkaline phosphatase family protein [candidate division KSB1 bacterium]MDZ7284690.1 alkaline phosphatase family protein [candidate division KSB1 bacterium]MDZ7297891.1 alkaline phosphatase family protein [candidate division KSB1 bacterium]MDZ7305981.1 alkaline phosphatase family protein [candidate division KSB1 bacterium]